MKNIKKGLILDALINFTGLFNKAPNEKALELYADLLSESFEPRQVTWALSSLIKKGSPFFPSCGEIFSELQIKQESKEDQAPRIAAEVLRLVREFSQHRESDMMAAASNEARAVFYALGSTTDIRLSENIEASRAQIERLAKSVLAQKESMEKSGALRKIGISNGDGLKKISFDVPQNQKIVD